LGVTVGLYAIMYGSYNREIIITVIDNTEFEYILYTMHNSCTAIINNAKSKFNLCERKIKTYLKLYIILYFILYNARELIID
jgi:hypothetical protein